VNHILLYFTVPHTSSRTPQGLLRDSSRILQISQKVLEESSQCPQQVPRTSQGLLKDLLQINKDSSRTIQGLFRKSSDISIMDSVKLMTLGPCLVISRIGS
jgi:hypothetical protein